MTRSKVALVATWVLASCGGGTETQNPVDPASPLVHFGNSGCKKESATNGGMLSVGTSRQRLETASYAAETAGLQCVAWETGASTVSVGLMNFHGACGAQWEGEAKLDAQGGLTLGLVNPKCLVAACGWCIYDWSFEVSGVKASAPLPVTIRIDTCPGGTIGEPVRTSTLTLPLDASPKGILCRYANWNALGWQAMELQTCGTVGMPCAGTTMCSQTGEAGTSSCHDGTVCTDNGNTAETVCAKPCTADADCGTMGAQACQAGLCRPKTAW